MDWISRNTENLQRFGGHMTTLMNNDTNERVLFITGSFWCWPKWSVSLKWPVLHGCERFLWIDQLRNEQNSEATVGSELCLRSLQEGWQKYRCGKHTLPYHKSVNQPKAIWASVFRLLLISKVRRAYPTNVITSALWCKSFDQVLQDSLLLSLVCETARYRTWWNSATIQDVHLSKWKHVIILIF